MRHYIDIIDEAALTPSQLAKHQGKYLSLLLQLAGNNLPVTVSPEYRDTYGPNVQLDPNMVPVLSQALNAGLEDGDIASKLPKNISVIVNGVSKVAPWAIIFKGKEFTGLEGKKEYNAGHLAELFMGVCVTSKFLNLGEEVSTEQVMAFIGFLKTATEGKNYTFSYEGTIEYPENAKNDTLRFRAVVPARSAEAFIEQQRAGKFAGDLGAVLAGAIRYSNESEGIANSINRVRKDRNNNMIEVISDGTSDAKGTKADLTLKVDGTKVNLLSLKTYSTDTLGQISGITYEALSKWFRINFGIDISGYKSLLDPTLPREEIYNNVLTKLYDEVVHPQVVQMVEDQSPGVEAAIVKRFAEAGMYYARGESMEDVEVVKLDDNIASGNYKVLRFSDDLYEAMKHLDLDVKYVGKGQGRTIQIWVKPAEGEKFSKGENKLCQFRTQKMGDSYRNYYETGSMLEALTEVSRGERPVSKLYDPEKGRLDLKPKGSKAREPRGTNDEPRQRR